MRGLNMGLFDDNGIYNDEPQRMGDIMGRTIMVTGQVFGVREMDEMGLEKVHNILGDRAVLREKEIGMLVRNHGKSGKGAIAAVKKEERNITVSILVFSSVERLNVFLIKNWDEGWGKKCLEAGCMGYLVN